MLYLDRINVTKGSNESKEIQRSRIKTARSIVDYYEKVLNNTNIITEFEQMMNNIKEFEILFYKDRFFKNVQTGSYIYKDDTYNAEFDVNMGSSRFWCNLKVKTPSASIYHKTIATNTLDEAIDVAMYNIITLCNNNHQDGWSFNR